MKDETFTYKDTTFIIQNDGILIKKNGLSIHIDNDTLDALEKFSGEYAQDAMNKLIDVLEKG